MTFKMAAATAITMRKTASSLKKMRFFNLSSRSLGRLEPVPGAAHGFQIPRVLRIRLDFLPDPAHVYIHGTRSHISGVAPHGVEKMVAAEDPAAVAGKVVEQAKFGCGRRYHAAPNGKRHGRGVDFNFPHLQGAGGQGTLEPAQNGFYAGHQLPWTKGLRNVIVSAEFEAENAIRFAALGGEKNNRHRCQANCLPDRTTQIQAVFARNHDVEDEQGRPLTLGIADNVGPGGIEADHESLVFQMMANQARNIGIVFDYEQARFHGIIVAKAVGST